MTPEVLLSSLMKNHSNATIIDREAPFAGHAMRSGAVGLLWGALGVLGFSFTLPATRMAVAEIDGTIVGLGRAIVAGILAVLMLAVTRQKIPPRRLWGRLGIVAFGCV